MDQGHTVHRKLSALLHVSSFLLRIFLLTNNQPTELELAPSSGYWIKGEEKEVEV